VTQKRILIVEDEESLLKLESILLSSRGYEVTLAASGRTALDILAQEQVDLVLLDIMLPEVDGYEVCRQIKNNPATAHVPVIMLTAKKSREDMARSEEAGADWYTTKPFKSAMVLKTVERYLADAE